MSLADQLASDFLLVDGLEPITWQRMDESGTVTNVISIPFALQRALDKALMFSERLVTADDRIITASEVVSWHFQVSAMGSFVPRKGDILIDERTTTWVIWEVKTQTFGTRYHCMTIRDSQLG